MLLGKSHTPFSDCYSFGMVVFEVLTRNYPYSKSEDPNYNWLHNIQDAVIKGILPRYSLPTIESELKIAVPEEILQIMHSCWNPVPSNRPTFEVIRNTCARLLTPFYSPEISEDVEDNKEETTKCIEFQNGNIHVLQSIAAGVYGTSWLSTVDGLDGQYVVKELTLPPDPEMQQRMIQVFQNEVELQTKLPTHPHIVSLIGYFRSPDKFWLIRELYNGGSLEEHLTLKTKINKDAKALFTVEELKHAVTDIVTGLIFLHEHGLVHLDLKVGFSF